MIDRILYKLDELVRPYVHKILVVIEPLLIDEDYYARVEGREIIANLSKAAGLATMIAAMRPDIDNIDECAARARALACSGAAHALTGAAHALTAGACACKGVSCPALCTEICGRLHALPFCKAPGACHNKVLAACWVRASPRRHCRVRHAGCLCVPLGWLQSVSYCAA